MNPAINDTGGAPGYVQLTLGRTRLLLPRSELLSLDAQPVIGPAGNDGSVGTVPLRNEILPLYNFDEQLQLLHEAQDDRRDCACLGHDSKAIGILCDKAEVVDGTGMQVIPLPACMKSMHTPVEALALQGTKILCVCNLEGITGLISALRGDGTP